MKSILIDPFTKEVSEVDVLGDLDSIRKLLFKDDSEGRIVTIAYLNFWCPQLNIRIEVDLWVDDEGLLKNNKLTKIRGYPDLLAGRILMLRTDNEGDCAPIPDEWAEPLKEQIIWTDMEIR